MTPSNLIGVAKFNERTFVRDEESKREFINLTNSIFDSVSFNTDFFFKVPNFSPGHNILNFFYLDSGIIFNFKGVNYT